MESVSAARPAAVVDDDDDTVNSTFPMSVSFSASPHHDGRSTVASSVDTDQYQQYNHQGNDPPWPVVNLRDDCTIDDSLGPNHRYVDWAEKRMRSSATTAGTASLFSSLPPSGGRDGSSEQQQHHGPRYSNRRSTISHYYRPSDLVSIYGESCDSFDDQIEGGEVYDDDDDDDDAGCGDDRDWAIRQEDDAACDYDSTDDDDICEERYRRRASGGFLSPSRQQPPLPPSSPSIVDPPIVSEIDPPEVAEEDEGYYYRDDPPTKGRSLEPEEEGGSISELLLCGRRTVLQPPSSSDDSYIGSGVDTLSGRGSDGGTISGSGGGSTMGNSRSPHGLQNQMLQIKGQLDPEEEGGGGGSSVLLPYPCRTVLPSPSIDRGGKSKARSRSREINNANSDGNIDLERRFRALSLPPPSSKMPSPNERYDGYQHCFITVREDHRFLALYTLLKKHASHPRDGRIVIFFSTNASAVYHAMLLRRLKFDASSVHEGMTRARISDAVDEFAAAADEDDDDDGRGGVDGGGGGGGGRILCVPDSLGRDVDIPPNTNWIVQYEPCSDPSEYIFRVGRISHDLGHRRLRGSAFRPNRDADAASTSSSSPAPPPPLSRALLFLTPDQFDFHRYYKVARIKVYEYEIPTLCRVQGRYIELLRQENGDGTEAKLRRYGKEANIAYLSAYASHEYKDIYDVRRLDVRRVALCFGFDRPPTSKLEEITSGRRGGSKKHVDNIVIQLPRLSSRYRDSPTQKIDMCQAGGKGVTTNKAAITKPSGSKESWRKPVKNEVKGWMKQEKSWKYADVHSDKMKSNANAKKSCDDSKPKSINIARGTGGER